MWSMSGIGAGEDGPPNAAGIEAMMRRGQVPDNEMGVGVPFKVVLYQGDDIAIWVGSAQVYSNGVSMRVDVRTRARSLIGRHGLHGRMEGEDPWGGFLLGVEFADGRRAETVSWPRRRRHPEATGDEPRLTPGGGSGGSRSSDLRLFLSPTPPPGPLTFVVSWLEEGVEETKVATTADAFAQAGDEVVELWPWEPEPHHDLPAAIDPPAGSWFAGP